MTHADALRVISLLHDIKDGIGILIGVTLGAFLLTVGTRR